MKEYNSKWLHFNAVGHRNMRATHRSTLEITREPNLTPRGDCIIGVNAEIGVASLPEWFKNKIRDSSSIIVLIICIKDICDSIIGRGHEKLPLSDPERIVARKSKYLDEKTLMISANKSARDIRRDLVEKLRGESVLDVYIGVIPGSRSG